MSKSKSLLVAITIVVSLVVVGLLLRSWNPKPTAILRPCGVNCGSERWTVKTLTDQDTNCINFTPQKTTISWLVSQQRPVHLPEDNRIAGVECQVWEVTARLTEFKSEEEDHDYHLVLQDMQSDMTLIAEIPDSSCTAVCSSPRRTQFEEARQSFSKAFGIPATRMHRLDKPIVVTVIGVGFFDRQHKQSGLAENRIELHPVLNINVTAR